MATSSPSIKRDRPFLNGMNTTITLEPVEGLTIHEDTGAGPTRQTILKFENVVLTITDAGSVGTFGQKLFTFPQGVIHVDGCVEDLDVSLTGGTNAQISMGSVANANTSLGDATDIDICPASSASATVANAFKGATATKLDGTTTPAACFLNGITSADPVGNKQITINGYVAYTWRIDGDY